MNEWFDDLSVGSLRGANLIGLSSSDGFIYWFSVDNFGTAHDHTGTWLNPRHFYMEHESQVGGQTFREEIHFRLRANNTRIVVSLVATLDGAVVQTINGTLYLQSNGNRVTGIAEHKENSIEIFPNPSKGAIAIESSENMIELLVYNELGQEVFRAKPNATEYDLMLHETGVFVLKIQTNTITETKKVIINE